MKYRVYITAFAVFSEKSRMPVFGSAGMLSKFACVSVTVKSTGSLK